MSVRILAAATLSARLIPVVFIVSCPSRAPGPADSPPPTTALDTAGDTSTEMTRAGVCSRCHVFSVLEWAVSAHVEQKTNCRSCHGRSNAHVADERNLVSPDHIPHDAAIAALCIDCHEEGCPESLEVASCQTCHHVHALVDPRKPRLESVDRLGKLYARWASFRDTMAAGEDLVHLEKWKAARVEFAAALSLIPANRDARVRIDLCDRRLDPGLPGFEVVGKDFDPSTGLPKNVAVPTLGLSMVLVPPGEFDIGADHLPDAHPVHTLSVEAFYLGTVEVTQAQWKRWMGSKPSRHSGKDFADPDRMPVESVSWDDCQTLICKLNEQVSGGGFRLPTEAEWEYACRAGVALDAGQETSFLHDVAWFIENSSRQPDDSTPFKNIDSYAPRAAGTRKPNPWGLHDMQGNVSEWCSSLWRPYLFDPRDGRESLTANGMRVLRGGNFADTAAMLGPAFRHAERAHRRYRWNGLRLARSVPVR